MTTPIRRKKPSLPSTPMSGTSDMDRFLQAIKTRGDIDDGARGDDEKLLTWREIRERLIAIGVADADQF